MPRLGVLTESRNGTFQQLRPICIALNQTASALMTANDTVKDVTEHLVELHDALKNDCNRFRSIGLDAQLADYVFFPIAQVLKASQKVTIRCLELCIECVTVLVQQGWRRDIAPALAAQLMILCTLLAQEQPKGFRFVRSTTDLQTSSYACLAAIAIAVDLEAKTLLTAEANFPQFGQTISVILDGISEGRGHEVQIAAAEALDSLLHHVLNRELCAGFLPGIVSRLTRVLSPTTKQRRNPAVLIRCMESLAFLVINTLSDKDDSIETFTDIADVPFQKTSKKQRLTTAEWKHSAAVQMKAALAPVMKLVTHGRSDVKASLGRLCLVILGKSPQSLESCASMALVTALTLTLDHDGVLSPLHIQALLLTEVSLVNLLQTTIYEWLGSLTTILQSSDVQAKILCLEQLSTARKLLADTGSNTRVLDGLLASGLRDGVSITLSMPAKELQHVSSVPTISSMDVARIDNVHTGSSHLLVKHREQEETMSAVSKLVCAISATDKSSAFVASLARDLQASDGQAQLANFWLLLTATTATIPKRNIVDEYLDFSGHESTSANEYLEQLYELSLSILTDATDKTADLRVRALALRTIALRAQINGDDFRYELIDTLYPVLQSLATPDDQLQHESSLTLDIIAASCGYDSVKQLVVQNVDYLTNAIALKLNAFDVSPQAAQVLLMMVKVAGPSLLPYLEDTVDSIFAVLENYHGYPLLVELLFKVLYSIAQEGARTPPLAIADTNKSGAYNILLEKWQASTLSELRDRLSEELKEDDDTARAELVTREPHPRQPWEKTLQHGSEIDDHEQTGAEDEATTAEDQDLPPPAPRSYALLLKITDLTQHFLPSASSTLRSSLLALIKTAIPALSLHENSFLPLINTLWPEIVSRLDDPEAHVQTMALEVISMLCADGGSFMRSRITSLWPRVVELHHEVSRNITTVARSECSPASYDHDNMAQAKHLERVVAKMQKSPADHGNTSVRLRWGALVAMLTSVVKSVDVELEILDQTMIMLTPSLEQKSVWTALEQQNADALWLAFNRSARSTMLKRPSIPDTVCWQFAEV